MFFEKHINLRMPKKLYDYCEEQVEKYPDRYENVSHYIRAAIIRDRQRDGKI